MITGARAPCRLGPRERRSCVNPRASRGAPAAALLAAGIVLSGAPTALAASREIERLQVQVAGLQAQLASLQRAVEDSGREVKRLNEALADQNAALRKGMQEARLQDEGIHATLKEIAERLTEVSDRLRPLRTSSAAPTSYDSPTTSAAPASSGPAAANAPPPRE